MLMRDGPGSGLAVTVLERSMLANLQPQWQDLCKRSAEDNVYYAPHYMLPLLDTVAAKAVVRIFTA